MSRIRVTDEVSWVLVALSPQAVMDAPLEGLRRVIHVVSLALVAAGIIIAALFALRIARPLNALSIEADRIRSFDFENQIEATSSIAELDNLIRAMTAMKATLRSFGRFVPKPEDGLAAFYVDRCSALDRNAGGAVWTEVDRFGAR